MGELVEKHVYKGVPYPRERGLLRGISSPGFGRRGALQGFHPQRAHRLEGSSPDSMGEFDSKRGELGRVYLFRGSGAFRGGYRASGSGESYPERSE